MYHLGCQLRLTMVLWVMIVHIDVVGNDEWQAKTWNVMVGLSMTVFEWLKGNEGMKAKQSTGRTVASWEDKPKAENLHWQMSLAVELEMLNGKWGWKWRCRGLLMWTAKPLTEVTSSLFSCCRHGLWSHWWRWHCCGRWHCQCRPQSCWWGLQHRWWPQWHWQGPQYW